MIQVIEMEQKYKTISINSLILENSDSIYSVGDMWDFNSKEEVSSDEEIKEIIIHFNVTSNPSTIEIQWIGTKGSTNNLLYNGIYEIE